MKTNKLKYLVVSLCLNNVKSTIRLVINETENIYRYEERSERTRLLPTRLENETDLGYVIRSYKHIVNLASHVLPLFISKMQEIRCNQAIFSVTHNDKIHTYKFRQNNLNNLIIIQTTTFQLTNSIEAPEEIYDLINYTVIALHLLSENLNDYTIQNLTYEGKNKSRIYNDGINYLAITPNNSYYIFPIANIKDVIKDAGIKSFFQANEAERLTRYEKFKNFYQDWMPLSHFFVTLLFTCVQIAVSLKQITK